MYNLLHIHSDPKFFFLTQDYLSDKFNNKIIFIGEETEEIKEKLIAQNIPFEIYQNKQESMTLIAEKYKDFDGAVLYDLDNFKIQLLDVLPKKVKTFWYFFGYEIYGKVPNKYLSKLTFKNVYPITLKNYSLKEFILRNISRIRGKEFLIDTLKLNPIYSKLDAIMLLSKQEYKEVSELIQLPPLILRSIGEKIKIKPFQKKNNIIVGNSQAKWNNHLDIIKIINSIPNSDTQYSFFFSYGDNGLYPEKVKKECRKNKNIHLIEDFLSRDKFDKIYNTSAALVINSYRQHAVGNILTAICTGTKIYLNQRNVTYAWLKELGFIIFDINTLKNDIKNNNIYLTEEEQIHNMQVYAQLTEKYSNEDFLTEVKKVLNS